MAMIERLNRFLDLFLMVHIQVGNSLAAILKVPFCGREFRWLHWMQIDRHTTARMRNQKVGFAGDFSTVLLLLTFQGPRNQLFGCAPCVLSRFSEKAAGNLSTGG